LLPLIFALVDNKLLHDGQTKYRQNITS
jgi:hypothetical protein